MEKIEYVNLLTVWEKAGARSIDISYGTVKVSKWETSRFEDVNTDYAHIDILNNIYKVPSDYSLAVHIAINLSIKYLQELHYGKL